MQFPSILLYVGINVLVVVVDTMNFTWPCFCYYILVLSPIPPLHTPLESSYCLFYIEPHNYHSFIEVKSNIISLKNITLFHKWVCRPLDNWGINFVSWKRYTTLNHLHKFCGVLLYTFFLSLSNVMQPNPLFLYIGIWYNWYFTIVLQSSSFFYPLSPSTLRVSMWISQQVREIPSSYKLVLDGIPSSYRLVLDGKFIFLCLLYKLKNKLRL